MRFQIPLFMIIAAIAISTVSADSELQGKGMRPVMMMERDSPPSPQAVGSTDASANPKPNPQPDPQPNPQPNPSPNPSPNPQPNTTPGGTSQPKPQPNPQPQVKPQPNNTTNPKPNPKGGKTGTDGTKSGGDEKDSTKPTGGKPHGGKPKKPTKKYCKNPKNKEKPACKKLNKTQPKRREESTFNDNVGGVGGNPGEGN